VAEQALVTALMGNCDGEVLRTTPVTFSLCGHRVITVRYNDQ